MGELASLNGISKQTLIYYDKEGILKPSYQDPHNLYRYYTADQLEELDSILILREMGLSLKEIRQHMQNRSPENALALLKKQAQAVTEKIDRLNVISRRISRKIESLQAHNQSTAPFEIKELGPQLLAVSPVDAPGGLLEADLALKTLLRTAGSSSAEHFYQLGDTVALHDLLAHNFFHFRYVFLPILKQDSHLQTMVKPAGTYAVGYHYGPYTTMSETYLFLLAQIAQHGKTPIGDAYEFCVFDSLTSYAKGYCTELQIQIG